MTINRRTLLKTSALGAGSLAITPSFNHLLAATQPSEHPHRFIFIRKSNGNIPSLFSLPTFSEEQEKKEQKKEAFETDLDKHELPQWLSALDGHKENMTIMNGISMAVSGGGHYSFSGCMGAYKAGRNTISGIKRTTIDFELAKLFPSPFGHVELSNVVTYTIDDLGTPITTLPGNKGRVDLHRLGHSRDMELRDIVKASHIAQIAKMVTKLKSVPEAGGTMFDNTTIIYIPETGAGHHGPDTEAPMVIMTGKKSKLDTAGRFIRLPFHASEGHKTLSNWYTTLLNAYGNPIEHYGDLDLELSRKKLDQMGAIKQLMG